MQRIIGLATVGLPKRTGFSMSKYVNHAKTKLRMTATIIIPCDGTRDSIILANDNKGQCQRYSG
jgi:hypothetical protein